MLEWALASSARDAGLCEGLRLSDWLQFSGPVQSALRGLTGWQAREYWFPEVRSLAGAAAMLSFALYPYVYLIARTAFQDLSRSAIEAGRLAGYGASGAFLRVAVPLARPAIVAGATLALMETLADFGTVSYFGVEVFTTHLQNWFSLGDSIAAAQLSACVLGFVVVLLALERANRGRAAYYGMAPRKARAHRLRGGRAAIAFAACAAPVVFGFALPALVLGGLAFDERIAPARLMSLRRTASVSPRHRVDRRRHRAGEAYAARLTRSPLVPAGRTASRAWDMPVPGAVIAVGVLFRSAAWTTPSGRLEQAFGGRFGLSSPGPARRWCTPTWSAARGRAATTEGWPGEDPPSMEDAAPLAGRHPRPGAGARACALLAPSLATALCWSSSMC